MLRFFCFVIFVCFALADGQGYYQKYSVSRNAIYHNRDYKCPQLKCHKLCQTYIGQDGCTYCGRCPVNSIPQRRCPEIECVSHSGVKCQKVKLPNGCLTCQCKRMYPFCPIPMCSQNCKLVPDQRGCYRCDCYDNPNCPQRPCPNSCTKYLGADGCPHCDCGEVAVCPEVNCDHPNCKPKYDYVTGCTVGCDCQPNVSSSNFRTVPR